VTTRIRIPLEVEEKLLRGRATRLFTTCASSLLGRDCDIIAFVNRPTISKAISGCSNGARTFLVLAAVLLASYSYAVAAGQTVYVAVQGTLEGADASQLPEIFVTEMTRTSAGAWRFEPVSSSSTRAPNRIEWRLTPGSDASGEVRTYGFSRAMMARLVGSHRIVTVEARLFLNNAYEAMVSGQIRDEGNPRDDEIANEIAELTRELISNASVHAANIASPAVTHS